MMNRCQDKRRVIKYLYTKQMTQNNISVRKYNSQTAKYRAVSVSLLLGERFLHITTLRSYNSQRITGRSLDRCEGLVRYSFSIITACVENKKHLKYF